MRTKHLFLALALPAAFAACSNEEFVNDNAAPIKGDLVELGEDFVLTGQGISNASTRGLWEQGEDKKLNWSWLPEIGGTEMVGGVAVTADRIGLCWTGELSDGTGSIGSRVFTNYEFLHNGWLAEKQEAAIFDICNGTLQNGKLYGAINVSGSVTTLDALKEAVEGDNNKVTIEGESVKLDANTGVFATENKAIFGGSYIVYYPYNNKFADAASLPATSPTSYEGVEVDKLGAAHVAKNTFLVGYAKDLIGGSQASKFTLNPLSAIISLQLRQSDGAAKSVEKVALWSDNGFVTSVNLDASKIKTSGAKAGEALYAGGKETSSTIVAELSTATALNVGTTESVAYKKIYLPILPTTLKSLKVVVYASDGTIAVKELSGEYKFEAAAGKSVKVDLASKDFKDNVRIAVDNDTWTKAVDNNTGKAVNVQVIGDITLSANSLVSSDVTVEGGKIIVPEDYYLILNNKSVMKSTIEVQGQTCCGNSTEAGKLIVNAGANLAGKVNVLAGATDKKNASLLFTHEDGKVSVVAETAEIVSDGTVEFEGKTDVRGTLTINKGTTATLTKETSDVNVKGGVVDNNGVFEVAAGGFAMLDANGETVAAAGKNFKNNGTFIDNVGTVIGGGTQYMVFGEAGEYICKVDGENRMNEAYENKIAASTIEIISAGEFTFAKVRKHNNKDVDIVVSANATKFAPKAAITIGNLTVNEGLRINKTAEITGANNAHVGWATITVNGDIIAGNNFYLSKDVRNMKANNLTVIKGGYAKFENREESQDKTLEISKTISVEKDGKFEIQAKTAGNNVALVTCTKLIEGGTFIGKPEVVAE